MVVRLFYSDKHTVFRIAKSDAKGGLGMTQFGRPLAELWRSNPHRAPGKTRLTLG
jgi:hypothetical protein